MAYSFPLSAAEFSDRLKMSSIGFYLEDARSQAETEGGEVLTARRGNRLWRGTIRLSPNRTSEIAAVEGLVSILQEPGATFLVGHPVHKYPVGDPDGSTLGATAITVDAAPADRRLVALAGSAPDGYALAEGDHISIQFGSGRRSYHRVIVGGSFSTGTTGNLQVTPPLPAAVSSGDDVDVVQPLLKAQITPNSRSGGVVNSAKISGAISFDWVQTLG